MIHSLESGTFRELWLSDRVKPKIVEQDIWVLPGEHVEKYLGTNHTLGTMILKFDSMEEMLNMIDNMELDIRVIVE